MKQRRAWEAPKVKGPYNPEIQRSNPMFKGYSFIHTINGITRGFCKEANCWEVLAINGVKAA